MTGEEARKLRPGDVVEFRYYSQGRDRGWNRGKVELIYEQGPHLKFVLTPLGRKSNGARKSLVRRFYDEIRLPPDPFPANVYADFLDDHGFPEAAAALRRAFPLGPPAELP